MIAYLGASLTAQRSGYRPLLHQELRAWTGGEPRAVNAGLGGIGSVGFAGLLDFLVVRHRPRVCLVETSFGDAQGFTPVPQVAPAVESIVRSLREAAITPVFLHLAPAGGSAGSSQVAAAYRRVADHYDVATIDLRDEVLDGADTLPDGIHLSAVGGRRVADRVAAAVTNAFPDGPPSEAPTALPDPMVTQRPSWLLSAFDPRWVSGHGTQPGRFRLTLPVVDLPPGASVTVTAPDGAVVIAVLVVADRRSGVVAVQVAGAPAAERHLVQVWDSWCDTGRLQVLHLPPGTGAVGGAAGVSVAMTDLTTADIDCTGAHCTVGHRGDRLRLVGAIVTGEPPAGEPSWWVPRD